MKVKVKVAAQITVPITLSLVLFPLMYLYKIRQFAPPPPTFTHLEDESHPTLLDLQGDYGEGEGEGEGEGGREGERATADGGRGMEDGRLTNPTYPSSFSSLSARYCPMSIRIPIRDM